MSTVSRRAFGKFLQELRITAGKSLLAAGLHVEASKDTILRLEDGIPTRLITSQITELLELYGAPAEVRTEALQLWAEVKQQAKAAALQGGSKGFWVPYADQFPTHFPHFLRLESAASHVTTHQLVLIPGLLQTSDYRRAMARVNDPGISLVDIERRVELAAHRQTRLEEGGFTLSVLLSEAALRHQPGDSGIMVGQLLWLTEVSERDNISIRVIPFATTGHQGLYIQSFTLLEFPKADNGLTEPPVVYLEGVLGALYHEQADGIERYKRAISALQDVALTEQGTRDMVLNIAKEYAA